MGAPYHSPGPDADRAFTLGTVVAMTVALVVPALLYHLQYLSTRGLFVYAVVGLPVVYILVSCLLSVWLGYDKRL